MTKLHFQTEEDYLTWAQENWLRFLTSDDDIWKPHTSALQPFFDAQNKGLALKDAGPEAAAAFELYKEVAETGFNAGYRKRLIQSHSTAVLRVLGFKDGELDPKITFPCVLVHWMEGGMGRSGSDSVIAGEFVFPGDFGKSADA